MENYPYIIPFIPLYLKNWIGERINELLHNKTNKVNCASCQDSMRSDQSLPCALKCSYGSNLPSYDLYTCMQTIGVKNNLMIQLKNIVSVQ